MSSTASIANRSFLVSRTMISGLSPRRRIGASGSDAGRAETAFLSPALGSEVRDDGEFRPGDAGEHELGDAIAGIDADAPGIAAAVRRVAVPRRNEAGPLVIGVDEA